MGESKQLGDRKNLFLDPRGNECMKDSICLVWTLFILVVWADEGFEVVILKLDKCITRCCCFYFTV